MKKKRDIYPSTDGEREEMIHEIVNTFVKDDAPEWVRKLIIDNLGQQPIEDWWFERLKDEIIRRKE